MPAQRDRTLTPGGETAAAVARKLREAIASGANGNGNGHGRRNGNGAIETPSAREIAIDVCSAILAEASAGTAEHSSDVVLITKAIGERMGIAGTDENDLLAAARMHDIGKVGIPAQILEKPGPLNDEEWALMHQHTVVGEEILSSVAGLEQVGRLVRHSHERWDGRGYPDGFAGSEIPLGSRIIFCADTFHAIRSGRPYRAARSARDALAEIKRCAGTQFDPQVADALEEVVRERGRRPRGAGGSSRLFALLMCLVIGGTGTAIARSGWLAEPAAPPSAASTPKPPPGCGTAACPTVARPVGGLGAVGGPGWIPGPRVVTPGLPGLLHKGGIAATHGPGNPNGDHGKSEQAKARHDAKAKDKGHGSEHATHPHSGNAGAESQGAAAPSSSSGSHGGGSSHHSSETHHSSGSGSGGSHGHGSGGGSGGASHGNSGNAGGSSGPHGK
jgi:hypothetical protein